MSLRRLPISAAALAAVAVLGLAACGDTKTKTVTVTATPTSATGAESGKTVNIIASVPPTDHGWLGAISKNAKAAAEPSTRTSSSSCSKLLTPIHRPSRSSRPSPRSRTLSWSCPRTARR